MSGILHVAMYPWLAMGHITAFFRLAVKLAQRGHRISFFIPCKTQSKIEPFNLHPDLIQFIPVVIPHVDGLVQGAETTKDIPSYMISLLAKAMDRTQNDIEAYLRHLKPDLVFFDVAYWIPTLTNRLGIKSVYYYIPSMAYLAYLLVPAREQNEENHPLEVQLMQQPKGFPPSTVKLPLHEVRSLISYWIQKEFGDGITYEKRHMISCSECTGISFRACREIEGPFYDYLKTQYCKPLFLSGPVFSDPLTTPLEQRWDEWLGKHKEGSVVYCSFGSECVMNKDQFEELLLGFELMGLPFLMALKPPQGVENIKAALPEGFENRVEGRGVITSEWMQQQLILAHPSVGCFVTHCGAGSICEALTNECQLVLLPNSGDQILHAKLLSGDLKVGVEIEKGEEDGLFTRECVCKAIKLVMDEESQVGREVRANHAKLRGILLSEGFESSYIDSFIKNLQDLCSS